MEEVLITTTPEAHRELWDNLSDEEKCRLASLRLSHENRLIVIPCKDLKVNTAMNSDLIRELQMMNNRRNNHNDMLDGITYGYRAMINED